MELESMLASEVAGIVIELRAEAESLTRVADFLEREIVTPFAEGASPGAEEPEPLKLEDVRAVLAEISRSGHTKDVRAKLDELGAAKLSEVDPARYPTLLEWAKGYTDGS